MHLIAQLTIIQVFGPAEQDTNVEQLNESIGQIYAAFKGEALAPLSGYVWVDVRDVSLAHVLAIVRCFELSRLDQTERLVAFL